MATARVSPAMKRLGIAVMFVLIVLAVWWLQRPTQTLAPPDTPVPAATPPRHVTAPAGSAASATRRVTQVTRLGSLDERRQLADQIAAAQAARGAVRAPERPRLPDDPGSRITPTDLRQAMRELVSELRSCYQRELNQATMADPNVEVTAHIELTGDPDIGTLIDARTLVEASGKPLPARFDDCLRSTIQLMALPPLAEGDKLEVHYPFKFASI